MCPRRPLENRPEINIITTKWNLKGLHLHNQTKKQKKKDVAINKNIIEVQVFKLWHDIWL
jgi:hypothetical protein